MTVEIKKRGVYNRFYPTKIKNNHTALLPESTPPLICLGI